MSGNTKEITAEPQVLAAKHLDDAESARRLSDVFEQDARRFANLFTEEEEARA